MAAKRKYNVKGIKDFIVLAGIFFFLGLWAVKDAWFPSPGVLEKHPQRVEIAFPVDGMIFEFNVVEGDSVATPKDDHEPTLLASLNDVKLQEQFDEKKQAYTEAAEGSPQKAALLEEVGDLKAQLEQYQLYCPELGKEKGGVVSEMLKGRYDRVQAGEPVMVIEPNKGFYLFNKSLAILSAILFSVFLGIHFMTQ
jgi:multidrug resistance efflux pump